MTGARSIVGHHNSKRAQNCCSRQLPSGTQPWGQCQYHMYRFSAHVKQISSTQCRSTARRRTTLIANINFSQKLTLFRPTFVGDIIYCVNISYNKMTEQSALLLRKQLAGRWLTVSVSSTKLCHNNYFFIHTISTF